MGRGKNTSIMHTWNYENRTSIKIYRAAIHCSRIESGDKEYTVVLKY